MHVSACVLLDKAEKDGKVIQLRLQWRSIVFIDYLHNILILAKQYVQSITIKYRQRGRM